MDVISWLVLRLRTQTAETMKTSSGGVSCEWRVIDNNTNVFSADDKSYIRIDGEWEWIWSSSSLKFLFVLSLRKSKINERFVGFVGFDANLCPLSTLNTRRPIVCQLFQLSQDFCPTVEFTFLLALTRNCFAIEGSISVKETPNKTKIRRQLVC